MDNKREQVLARLDQRNKEREINLESQRQNKTWSKSQNVQNFDQQFEIIRQHAADLLKQCDEDAQLSNVTTSQLINDKLDEVGSLLQKLHKLVSEFATSLSSYDMRRSQKYLQDLNVDFLNVQNKFQPKKRFAFTSRVKKDGLIRGADFDGFNCNINSLPMDFIDGKNAAAINDDQVQIDKNLSKSTFNAKSANHANFNFGAECTGTDVALADLSECVIKITGFPSTLYVNKLENCTVLCFPVSTSVFIENCTNVEFVLACQQLRVHNSSDCKFYLHVTSKAIIEDCSRLLFASYCLKLSENKDLRKLFDEANLDYSKNNWDNVDDFNWPVKTTPSPNWSVMKNSDRKSFLI